MPLWSNSFAFVSHERIYFLLFFTIIFLFVCPVHFPLKTSEHKINWKSISSSCKYIYWMWNVHFGASHTFYPPQSQNSKAVEKVMKSENRKNEHCLWKTMLWMSPVYFYIAQLRLIHFHIYLSTRVVCVWTDNNRFEHEKEKKSYIQYTHIYTHSLSLSLMDVHIKQQRVQNKNLKLLHEPNRDCKDCRQMD